MPTLDCFRFLRVLGAAVVMAVLPVLLVLPAAPAGAQRAKVSEADRLLADVFTRDALAVIARQDPPDAAHRAAAGTLLQLATELTPDDPERLRLYAEVLSVLDDPTGHATALARYVRLRPTDDAAMLQLLMLRLGDTQTLDGRLAALERVLNAANAGSRLSRPLRSRLAMLAAQASAELEDQGRHLKWLRQAAKLDPANATAAAAMFQAIASRTDDPKLLGASAMNWVKASPVDPQARLVLASILVNQGAYLDAAQQFANAARFNQTGPLPWRAYRGWALSLGATGDDATALGLLVSLEQFIQQNAEANAANAGDDAAAAATATELPAEVELVRLVLLGGADYDNQDRDTAAIAEVYQRVVAQLSQRVAEDVPDAALDLAWVQAVFAPDPAEAEETLADLPSGGDDALKHRAQGWLLMRQGDTAEAAKAFERAPDDPFAKLGLAMLADPATPDNDRLTRDVIRRAPESLAALVAARSIIRAGYAPEPTPEGQTLLDLMKRTEMSVWRMDLASTPWVRLQTKVQPTIGQALWPTVLEVSVRNAASVPLAMGTGQPMQPVIFLNIGVFRDGQMVGSLPTQVVDVGRKLTLDPGQRMVVKHRLDWGMIGQMVAASPGNNLSYAVSATLDPRVLPDGSVMIGPLGSAETMRGLLIRGEAATDESVQRWMDAMSGGSERDEVVALIRLAMLSETQGGVTPATVQKGRELLAERAAAMDPSRLALAANHLDPAAADAHAQRVIDLAKRSEVDAVRIAYLIGQVQHGTDPGINTALRSGSPRLRAFAEAWKAVVDTPDPVAETGTAENPLGE